MQEAERGVSCNLQLEETNFVGGKLHPNDCSPSKSVLQTTSLVHSSQWCMYLEICRVNSLQVFTNILEQHIAHGGHLQGISSCCGTLPNAVGVWYEASLIITMTKSLPTAACCHDLCPKPHAWMCILSTWCILCSTIICSVAIYSALCCMTSHYRSVIGIFHQCAITHLDAGLTKRHEQNQ